MVEQGEGREVKMELAAEPPNATCANCGRAFYGTFGDKLCPSCAEEDAREGWADRWCDEHGGRNP